MNFEDWWNTLTIKEQTLIGKNNAKFVWSAACEECALRCEQELNDLDSDCWMGCAEYLANNIRADIK